MTVKPPTKSKATSKSEAAQEETPTDSTPSSTPTSEQPSTPTPPSTEATPTEEAPSEEPSTSDHPAAQGIPLPADPSAAALQEEQDELQQQGRVKRAVADQIDNEPGYSKDQLAHMAEYWSHGDAVGEEVTPEDDDE